MGFLCLVSLCQLYYGRKHWYFFPPAWNLMGKKQVIISNVVFPLNKSTQECGLRCWIGWRTISSDTSPRATKLSSACSSK